MPFLAASGREIISVVNLGELTKFPFLASVWGDVATWVGATATGLAALIAAITYALGRRGEKWAQAQLVYFEPGADAMYEVHNRSDKPIVDVRAVLKRRSLYSAARVGSYSDSVIFRSPTVASFPSYEFYLSAKQGHSRRLSATPQSNRFAEKIEPDHAGKVKADWIHVNGYKSYIEFRDVHGRDWQFDVEAERLRPLKRRPTFLRLKSKPWWAAWWIAKNNAIYIWRNCLYHPNGKPPR